MENGCVAALTLQLDLSCCRVKRTVKRRFFKLKMSFNSLTPFLTKSGVDSARNMNISSRTCVLCGPVQMAASLFADAPSSCLVLNP